MPSNTQTCEGGITLQTRSFQIVVCNVPRTGVRCPPTSGIYLCPFVTENCTLDVGINKGNYKLHGGTVHQKYQTLYCPTNANKL